MPTKRPGQKVVVLEFITLLGTPLWWTYSHCLGVACCKGVRFRDSFQSCHEDWRWVQNQHAEVQRSSVPNLKLNLCRAAHRGSRVSSVPEVYVHIRPAIGVQFLLSPLLSYRSDGPITILTILVADCDTAHHRSQVWGKSLLGGSESPESSLELSTNLREDLKLGCQCIFAWAS